MADHPDLDARIAGARNRLAAKLGELQHRLTETRLAFSPRTYLGNPWVQFGLGTALGFLLGRRKPMLRLTTGETVAAVRPEGVVMSVIRASVVALASSALKRAIEHATGEVNTHESSR